MQSRLPFRRNLNDVFYDAEIPTEKIDSEAN